MKSGWRQQAKTCIIRLIIGQLVFVALAQYLVMVLFKNTTGLNILDVMYLWFRSWFEEDDQIPILFPTTLECEVNKTFQKIAADCPVPSNNYMPWIITMKMTYNIFCDIVLVFGLMRDLYICHWRGVHKFLGVSEKEAKLLHKNLTIYELLKLKKIKGGLPPNVFETLMSAVVTTVQEEEAEWIPI